MNLRERCCFFAGDEINDSLLNECFALLFTSCIFFLFFCVMFNVSLLHPELTFKAVRSSGKGGQNVNKVSSKVELHFNVAASAFLNDEQKSILMQKLSNRISNSGWLMIDAQERRSQLANKKAAIARFDALLTKALEKKKARIKTQPSKAAIARRLEAKRKNAEKKQLRNKNIS